MTIGDQDHGRVSNLASGQVFLTVQFKWLVGWHSVFDSA